MAHKGQGKVFGEEIGRGYVMVRRRKSIWLEERNVSSAETTPTNERDPPYPYITIALPYIYVESHVNIWNESQVDTSRNFIKMFGRISYLTLIPTCTSSVMKYMIWLLECAPKKHFFFNVGLSGDIPITLIFL